MTEEQKIPKPEELAAMKAALEAREAKRATLISKGPEMALPPEASEFLRSEKNDFYLGLQQRTEAMESWSKYKTKHQKTLLLIETETYLRELVEKEFVPRGMVAKDNVDELVEGLMKEKISAKKGFEPLTVRVEFFLTKPARVFIGFC